VGGAIGGGIIGHASSANAAPASGPSPVPAPTPAPTSTTWRRLQPGDTVTAGQRIAFTISGPGNVPLTPDILTALNAALPAAIAQAPSANFQAYPPGTQLPSNWPSDDNFGPGAYRWMATAPSNSPPFNPALIPQMMPVAVTVTAWAQ